MKPSLAVCAIVALSLPSAALAVPDIQPGTTSAPATRAASVAGAIVVADRGHYRREVIIRDHRGRGREFVYRGHNLVVVRRPAFVYPRGFGYRHWRAGELLPLALLSRPYFFLEYEALGLDPPPPGHRWVRYGPDLVLVNLRTREIDDVAYGAIEEEY